MTRREELVAMLKALKLPDMAASYAELATKAAKDGSTHEAFFYEVVRAECAGREQRRIDRLQHRSGLPAEKTFATLRLNRFSPLIQQQIERLRGGEFVAEAVNCIAVGRPGAGKSHLLAAVGHELVAQGHAVRYTSTATLVQQLLAAKRGLALPKLLAALDRFDLVILDDIGYVQHDRDEMEVLFTFLAERYERRSVAITTNLVFSDWTRIWKDPMTTLAAIDRVVHHAIILDLMTMESYRAQEAGGHAARTA
jgi:DNA replication protein DnaC